MERSLVDLKSTIFGGFDKESVLCYLRDLVKEHEQETNSLQAQIRQLYDQLETLRQTSQQQQEEGQEKLNQVGRIADAIQHQSQTLERQLSDNQRLQAEVDHYRAREERIQEQEQAVQAEVEALRAKTQEECAEMKRNVTLEIQELIRAMEGKIAAMTQLSQEFDELCKKGEQINQRYG